VFDWLGLGAVNHALLWGGALVAAPILIHLLSRRRFRTVDWAAMEFLLDADRRNRRRIRLEHLLLLLLRCLIVLLIALLVARVFLEPTGLAARAVAGGRIEHIVLLDDSPSMEARAGAGTVFDETRDGLATFIRRTARRRPGDAFTLLATSRPDRPVLAGHLLAEDTADAAVRAVRNLEIADRSAAYDAALLDLEKRVGSPRGNLNRQVLILTDFRRRDWQASAPGDPSAAGASATPGANDGAAAEAATETPEAGAAVTSADRRPGLPGLLARLADGVDGLAIADVGGAQAPNLAVTDIALGEKTVVAGVPARFEVTVANYGPADAADVDVTFTAAGAVPLRARLDTVPAGGEAAVPFTFTFGETGSARVRAEIGADAVPRDNIRFAAPDVKPGVPILLVDGEPSSEYGETETFYLHRALDPPGEVPSGNDVEVVSENRFEETPLHPFQVVVLANLYRLTEDRAAALADWVRDGGGLVVFLGDQVDAMVYNEQLRRAADLLGLVLTEVRGDPAEERWVHLVPQAANHPVLRVFEGTQNPFLERVKFFRWWGTEVTAKDTGSGRTRVLARFSDTDASPAVVETRLGRGRVLTVTTTADAEWTNWCADPSYLVTVLEMTRHVARPAGRAAGVAVGAPIRTDLDPATYAIAARVQGPDDSEDVAVQAVATDQPARMRLTYADTARRGFYRVRLKGHDGTEETRLFAANIDPTEGDLAPADADALRRAVPDADLVILEGRDYLGRAVTGDRAEMWRPLAIALVLALFGEQALAWWFGRRR
jgi:hypothetical protein